LWDLRAGGLGRRRTSLPLTVLEVPTMALRATGVFVPAPEGQQNNAKHNRNQEIFLHHDLRIRASGFLNMRVRVCYGNGNVAAAQLKPSSLLPNDNKELEAERARWPNWGSSTGEGAGVDSSPALWPFNAAAAGARTATASRAAHERTASSGRRAQSSSLSRAGLCFSLREYPRRFASRRALKAESRKARATGLRRSGRRLMRFPRPGFIGHLRPTPSRAARDDVIGGCR
jgi:hypothetical protein